MSTNRNRGFAILIVGMLLLMCIAAPLFAIARARQRRYFRACERAYDITIHDPHVWEMRVDEMFLQNDRRLELTLSPQPDPQLEALRQQALRPAIVGGAVLVIGFIVLFGIASIVGFD